MGLPTTLQAVLALLMVIFSFGQPGAASSLNQTCLQSLWGSGPVQFRWGSHPLRPVPPAPSGTAAVCKGSICRALASPIHQ